MDIIASKLERPLIAQMIARPITLVAHHCETPADTSCNPLS